MTHPQDEPTLPLSQDQLLAGADAAGIRLPPDQVAGVLKGARHLREAGLAVRALLAEAGR